MRATQILHDLGQSLWLDNITRDLLESGTLARYIEQLSVTGLTSNPTIFDHAIKNSPAYDAAIGRGASEGKSAEELFFDLALDDLTRARCTSIASSRRARFGTSTLSTSGASNWARCSPGGSFPSSKAGPSLRSRMTARRTP
jgi:hypothetical protein